MYELPLFPLHTVLFPGTPIHLHIFEERYKAMMGLCIQERRPFGVTLIRKGNEAHGPIAEPYQVGCSAQILQVTHLEQGRMNIVATGMERFRIVSTDRESASYLLAMVEPCDLEIHNPFDLERQAVTLRKSMQQMVEKLASAGGSSFDLSQLPEDPIALAYLAAAILQSGPVQKQALLELEDAGELLSGVRALYRRELALLDAILGQGNQDQGSAFSTN
jgi:uncharacterized protein